MSQRTVACRPRFANLIHGQLPVYEIRAVRSAPFHAQVMRPTAGCDAVSSSVRWWIVGIISFSPNLCLYRTRTDPLVLPPNWARDLFLAGLHLIQVNFLGGLACSKGTKRPIKTGQAYSKMHTRVQQEYIFPRPPQIHSWSMFKFQKLQSVTVPSLISSGSVNRSIKAATAAIQKKKKKKNPVPETASLNVQRRAESLSQYPILKFQVQIEYRLEQEANYFRSCFQTTSIRVPFHI